MFSSEPRYISRRSPFVCAHGCISTSQPLASEIGLQVLKKGGNAADACVAAVAALNVTEPVMCGIGGDAFCLFYDAKTKKISAMNGSGAAPAALTVDLARATAGPGGKAVVPDEYDMMNFESAHCVTVPGAAACWADACNTFGSKPLSELLQPAIDLAEGGFPVHPIAAQLWADQLNQLTTRWGGLKGNPGARAFLKANGEPPKAGEYMRMPELAQTFRELAARGRDGFYKGRVAAAVVEVLARHGGVMSAEDLAGHQTEKVAPVSAPFGDGAYAVHQIPPNGSGLASLLALRILDTLPPLKGNAAAAEAAADGGAPSTSAEELHRVVEALRLAFADVASHVGDYRNDPAALKALLDEVLSDEYTAKRAALVDDAAAAEAALASEGLRSSTSETTYLTCVDREGNACSFICSNYMGFGSGLVPVGCGFTLHNRGANFRLGPPDHPNVLRGGRRPYHTILPSMVTDNRHGGRLVATFGVMGGFMQPQGQVQVLYNLLKHGMDPQAALDAPRLCLEPRNKGPSAMQLDSARPKDGVVVYLEDGIAGDVRGKLRAKGHDVAPDDVRGRKRNLFGRGQVIAVTYVDDEGGEQEPPAVGVAVGGGAADGGSPRKRLRSAPAGRRVLWAGSDGRGDGCAMGW